MFEQMAAVLQLVNVARVATGLEPIDQLPHGQRQSSSKCPIARALNFGCLVSQSYVRYVETSSWGDREDLQELDWVKRARAVRDAWDSPDNIGIGGVPMPDVMRRFIVAFDEEEIPELVELEEVAK